MTIDDDGSSQTTNRVENDTGDTANKRKEEKKRRQKNRAIERKARERSKRLKLNNEVIEWGDYNPDFPTSGTVGELELHDFLSRLEKVSTFAETRTNATARLLHQLRANSKLEILAELKVQLHHFPYDDVILLDDTESLKNALDQPFRVPLLHRTTKNHSSLGGSSTPFSIQDLLEHLAQDETASISVYDYSIKDPQQRTRQTTVRELLSCFRPENVRGTALNFLDIENRTRIQFCPHQIKLQDIVTKLEDQKQPDKGKTGSEWNAQPGKEFFLLSRKNSVSTIHVDTGGAVTWVLIIEGRKIWYFPQCVTTRTVRWLAQAGSQVPEDYNGGWVKVELRPGDLLVMPPSFPHAVFTPEDCLAVGGQFYTAGHLSHSLEGLKLQEDYPDISNEDLHESSYRTLARILRGCSVITTSVEKAEIISSCCLFPDPSAHTGLKTNKNLIDALKSLGVSPPQGLSRNELLELLSQASPQEEFLGAIQSFRREFTADR
ncbi:MAG: JmjC domain-containing histone demethylation protein 1 [Geoglossum umbratile]|nr:MAG: JmjC domain-containing histone demethylation protein 1 [Geoglossum umbratile]